MNIADGYGKSVNSTISDLSELDNRNVDRLAELIGGGVVVKNRDHILYKATGKVFTCDEINDIVGRQRYEIK